MTEKEVSPQELMRAFRQLRRTNWKGKRPVEGCTHSESMMLYVLRRHQECSMEQGMKASELSGFLRVSSPTVTQMVNVLEARGLLERRPDPTDRRIVRIRLTEEGKRETGLAEAAMMESLNGFIRHIGHERAEQLIELLDEMHHYYHREDEKDD
jgi:DNA-binding MarR family transcriptional regulator